MKKTYCNAKPVNKAVLKTKKTKQIATSISYHGPTNLCEYNVVNISKRRVAMNFNSFFLKFNQCKANIDTNEIQIVLNLVTKETLSLSLFCSRPEKTINIKGCAINDKSFKLQTYIWQLKEVVQSLPRESVEICLKTKNFPR